MIENIQYQLKLEEERSKVLVSLNEELTKQLDAVTDRVVTQKSV